MQATCSTNDLYVYQINIVQSFPLSSLKEKLDSFEDDKKKYKFEQISFHASFSLEK